MRVAGPGEGGRRPSWEPQTGLTVLVFIGGQNTLFAPLCFS